MATITKIQRQSGVRYKVLIKARDGRVLKCKTFSTKSNARQWAKRIEGDRELMQVFGMKGSRMTLRECADEFLKDSETKTSPSHVRWWRSQLGDRKLADITTTDIKTLLNAYAGGKAMRGDGVDKNGKPKVTTINRTRSPATVNRMKAALSALLKFAVGEEYIADNPARKIPNRKENNERKRYLGDEHHAKDELDRLLAACKQSEWPKLHLLVILAISTGARRGELLGLSWMDIDFQRKTASLHDTKNSDSRLLPLPTPAITELMKFRKTSGLLFPGLRKPKHPFNPHKVWNKALEEAGISDFRFHDLRHTAASYLVMAGATLHECAEVLGHRSIQTTKRYAHLSTEHKAQLTERVMTGILGAKA